MYPDISDYRHVTDWSKVKCPFIIGRATQGTGTKTTDHLLKGVDRYLDEFIRGCEANKIPYWLYVFLENGNEKAQVEFVVKTCKGKIGDHFIGFVLDVEDKNAAGNVKAALDWISGQYKTMLYTMYAQYATYKAVIQGRPSDCAWWEARYGKNTGSYSSAYPCHDGADLHQYTSVGTYPGIAGQIDLSRLTGTKPESFFTGKKVEDMGVTIGSARISEKGTIYGAKGDQKQGKAPDYVGEVSLEKFYQHSLGWVCLKPKDAEVAEKLAYAMEAICNNKNFGYSQYERLTGYNEAAKVGFDPAKVKTPCNIDCSEAVRVCLAYAGIKVADFTTSNEVSVIMATKKFDKITTVKENELYTGSILVTKRKGHTVIVTSGKAWPSSKPVAKPVAKPATPKVIKATEAARAYYKGFSKTMTTNQDCHIRNGAGKDKKSLGILPKGTAVRCYGYYTPYGGTKWFYVQVSHNGIQYTGFVSGKCLD